MTVGKFIGAFRAKFSLFAANSQNFRAKTPAKWCKITAIIDKINQ